PAANAPAPIPPSYDMSGALTVSVPSEEADDAREFLKQKTSLMTDDATPERPDDNTSLPAASLADVGQEILELRRQHVVAVCKYCGISTLDVGEMELDSRMIALMRVAGLGVNTAAFSEFDPGERICTDSAVHDAQCELCGR